MSTDMNTNNEQAVHTNLDQDGILTITFDMPGRSANVLNDDLSDGFTAARHIESDG